MAIVSGRNKKVKKTENDIYQLFDSGGVKKTPARIGQNLAARAIDRRICGAYNNKCG